MEWICPDCALQRGLPPEHYHKNFYSPGNPEAFRILRQRQQEQQQQQGGTAGESNCQAGWKSLFDMSGFMCS